MRKQKSIPKIRSGVAIAAKMRRSAKFHDRREARGGDRNFQLERWDEGDFDDDDADLVDRLLSPNAIRGDYPL